MNGVNKTASWSSSLNMSLSSLGLSWNFFVSFFKNTQSEKKPACRQTENFATIRIASNTKLSGKLSNPIKMSCNTKNHQ